MKQGGSRSLAPAAGIDGCPSGWLCISEASGLLSGFVTPNIAAAIRRLEPGTMVGIDIPIGLPEADSRKCDLEARRMLGRRGVTVFPAPLRATIDNASDEVSYQDASEIQRQNHARGKGPSQQAWRLLPKIREVNTLLRADMRRSGRVLEVHPEVSFSLWNGGTAIPLGKKTREGRAHRARLIDDVWPGQRDRLLDELRHQGRFAVDDLHDAFAALWSMRRYRASGAIALTVSPERDRYNLPMQIIA